MEPSEKSPEMLVAQGLKLVGELSSKFHKRLPPGYQLDDLFDIGQDALLRIVAEYDPARGEFAAWANWGIRHALLNWLKREEIRRHSPLTEMEPDSRPTPEVIAIDSERGRQIREAIQNLPERQRRIVHATYWDDETQREIADESGISQVRVCQELKQAKWTLRRVLPPDIYSLAAAA